MEASGFPRKRLRTRKALIHAARDLVYERGHKRISIQDITERATVGTGTFYNYFETTVARSVMSWQ